MPAPTSLLPCEQRFADQDKDQAQNDDFVEAREEDAGGA